jgi:hypothetical protein
MRFDDQILLATGPWGSIQTCRCCSVFQLEFNNLLLTFQRTSLEQFKETIALRYEQGSRPGADRDCRFFCLRTSAQGLQLTFSFDEMGALLQMIQEAELNLELLHYRTDP